MNDKDATAINDHTDPTALGDQAEAKMLRRLFIDLERSRDASRGLAARPQDAMKSVWAAPLREQPWMAAVVIQVAYFARNDDFCTEDLPYERIAATLSKKGTPIPIDQTLGKAQQRIQIRQRVWQALDLLRSIEREWYEANIEGELHRRRTEVEDVSLESLEDPTPRADGSGDNRSAQPRLSRSIRKNPAIRLNRPEQLADISLACGIAAEILTEQIEAEVQRIGEGRESERLLVLQVGRQAALEIGAMTTAPATAVDFGRSGAGLPAVRVAARAGGRGRRWTTYRLQKLEADASAALLEAMELMPLDDETPGTEGA